MRTVYPIGTTIYQPDRCFNGYTLLWGGLDVRLIDMNGRVAHSWQVDTDLADDRVDRAHLLAGGNVLVQRGGMMATTGSIEEYTWDGELAWRFEPDHARYLGPHHDVWRKSDGNTLVIVRDPVPEPYLKQIRFPRLIGHEIYGDAILEVNPEGEVVWTWHGYEHLDLNHYRILASPGWFAGPHNSTECDWMHVNTVRQLPENRHYDAGDERFRPGNIMISPRNLDTVYLIDHETSEVVWEYTGDYFGGLSGQHEPHMIGPDLPGAGNVLIFDNGASPWKDLGHAAHSFVLEVDPVTKEVVWVYQNRFQFYSPYTSSAQRLPNGNTLVCESAGRRVFEVTPERETVWENVGGSARSYRYPYDYCPPSAALGRPREVSVTPPPELRIEPDEPL